MPRLRRESDRHRSPQVGCEVTPLTPLAGLRSRYLFALSARAPRHSVAKWEAQGDAAMDLRVALERRMQELLDDWEGEAQYGHRVGRPPLTAQDVANVYWAYGMAPAASVCVVPRLRR